MVMVVVVIDKRLMFKIFRLIQDKYFRWKMKTHQAKLAEIKADQKTSFHQMRNKFLENYNKLKKYNIDCYLTPIWRRYNTELEKSLLPYPSFSFLQNPSIMITMFAAAGSHWLEKELTFLESKLPQKKLKVLLEEDYVGGPLLSHPQYLTSGHSIHHLYHLVNFQEATSVKLSQIKTVVDWGGGYGNLIKILKRLKAKPCTYIIIDTPLMSCLQWLYLGTIFGKKNVNLLLAPKDTIKTNKINLLPLSLLDKYTISADLLISTWALSESSKYAQDYVVKHQWFGAKHLLLAYQDSNQDLPEANRVGKMAQKKGAVIADIEFLPGNHYAFI